MTAAIIGRHHQLLPQPSPELAIRHPGTPSDVSALRRHRLPLVQRREDCSIGAESDMAKTANDDSPHKRSSDIRERILEYTKRNPQDSRDREVSMRCPRDSLPPGLARSLQLGATRNQKPETRRNTNMSMSISHTTIDLQAVPACKLSTVAGGRTDTPPPHQDFASVYGNQVKQDFNDFMGRANSTAADLKQHHWTSAAKNFGGTMLDEVKTGADAILPIKALKFW
jgi:hypothetical protein